MSNQLTPTEKRVLTAIEAGFNNDITLTSHLHELNEMEVFDIVFKLASYGEITPLESRCYMKGGEGRFPESEHSIWTFDGLEVIK